MVSKGYKNNVFDDDDGFFSAKKMLSRWTEINREYEVPYICDFGKAMNYWLNIDEAKLIEIEKGMITGDVQKHMSEELIWRAEIHKDLKPNSPIYNISEAINEYYLFSKNANKHKIFLLKESEQNLNESQIAISRSEGMQAYWNGTRQCPSIKDYTLYAQSLGLFQLFVNTMQLYSSKQDDFSKLIKYVSLLKCLCEDHKGIVEELSSDDDVRIGHVTKKIYTFPVVYAINTQDSDKQLENVMRLQKHEHGLKEYISTKLEDSGALSFSENFINRVRDAVMNEIARFGGNKLMEEWINEYFTL